MVFHWINSVLVPWSAMKRWNKTEHTWKISFCISLITGSMNRYHERIMIRKEEAQTNFYWVLYTPLLNILRVQQVQREVLVIIIGPWALARCMVMQILTIKENRCTWCCVRESWPSATIGFHRISLKESTVVNWYDTDKARGRIDLGYGSRGCVNQIKVSDLSMDR